MQSTLKNSMHCFVPYIILLPTTTITKLVSYNELTTDSIHFAIIPQKIYYIHDNFYFI